MKSIIAPIQKEVLKAELTKDKFVRKTNNTSNEIYAFTYHDSPNLMKEVGRLREISFRTAGGGTGEEIDIDYYDTKENPYKQLIVWNPEKEEIIGGYRYFNCQKAKCAQNEKIDLSTTHLFHFSDNFKQNYLAYTIELGRSFVRPEYQTGQSGRKGIFALDNLWDGLGALIVDNPNVKYFFGKVTMYPHFNQEARDYLLYFINTYFADKDNLVKPIIPLKFHLSDDELKAIFPGNDYKEDYKILSQKVRDLGVNIPPLINAYMNLSPTMRSFGTAMNDEFGNVEETGIMITIEDIYNTKTKRHIESYLKEHSEKL
ncbi:MAG: GNAT family N-acetyltransferase [Bacteroidales bacterium]|nr:GNAT family N-acetyltransferase [Bacteroidales bacterium]MCF8458127.1 GNAT family N-acetyltransferase [Bacteroidales bacterium]